MRLKVRPYLGSEEDFLRANAIVVIVFLVAGPLLAWTCIGYCVVWERQRRVRASKTVFILPPSVNKRRTPFVDALSC